MGRCRTAAKLPSREAAELPSLQPEPTQRCGCRVSGCTNRSIRAALRPPTRSNPRRAASQLQSNNTLPHSPASSVANACSKSAAGYSWVMTGVTSRPVWSMVVILYQVSNIRRP